jgi:hypothetical protein
METPDDIKNLLGPNEKVEIFIKERICHPQISIDPMVVMNERVILRRPHAFGLKKDCTDYCYSDIAGVATDKDLLRSTLKLTLKGKGESLELGKLPTPLREEANGRIRENVGRFQAPFATGYSNASLATK